MRVTSTSVLWVVLCGSILFQDVLALPYVRGNHTRWLSSKKSKNLIKCKEANCQEGTACNDDGDCQRCKKGTYAHVRCILGLWPRARNSFQTHWTVRNTCRRRRNVPILSVHPLTLTWREIRSIRTRTWHASRLQVSPCFIPANTVTANARRTKKPVTKDSP